MFGASHPPWYLPCRETWKLRVTRGGDSQFPHVRHTFMIPPNNNRQHRRDAHAGIVLPKIAQLPILLRDGHGWEIMFVPDRLEIAAEEE